MPNICMVYWHVYELIQGDGTLSTVSADDVDCDLLFSHQINYSLFTTHKCDTLCSMFKFISLSLILLDLLWQQQQWQWLKVVKNVGWWVGAKVHVIPTFWFLLIIPAAFVNSTHNTSYLYLPEQLYSSVTPTNSCQYLHAISHSAHKSSHPVSNFWQLISSFYLFSLYFCPAHYQNVWGQRPRDRRERNLGGKKTGYYCRAIYRYSNNEISNTNILSLSLFEGLEISN